MSFLHVHHALESTLKTNLKITAAVLGEMADLDSGECWPAYETIARRSSVSRGQAIRNVNALISMGIVQKTGSRPCLNGLVNVYTISLKALESLSFREGVAPTPPVAPMQPQGVAPMQPRTINKPSTISKPKKTRICPESWHPDQKQIDKLAVKYPSMDLKDALDEMKEHAFDKPKDHWNLVFNTWCRNKNNWSSGNEKTDGKTLTAYDKQLIRIRKAHNIAT